MSSDTDDDEMISADLQRVFPIMTHRNSAMSYVWTPALTTGDTASRLSANSHFFKSSVCVRYAPTEDRKLEAESDDEAHDELRRKYEKRLHETFEYQLVRMVLQCKRAVVALEAKIDALNAKIDVPPGGDE